MSQEFVQVRPDNGYLIHAVPASAKAVEMPNGIERWSRHGPICHKIQTRDAQRLPNLSFQFDREKLHQREYVRLPFDKALIDADEYVLPHKLCKTCKQRVLWAIEP